MPNRNNRRARWRRSDGIVMVETTLTLVVVSLGLLAVFALFSRGLERAAESEADTQIALFADNVFAGLHAAAMQAAESNAWEAFWGTIEEGAPNALVAASGVWLDEGDGVAPPDISPDILVTNVYRNASLRGTDVTNIVNHALRYVLTHSPHFQILPSGETNMHFVAVTLSVWPGEFGSTSAVPPRVFYTEYRKPDFF